MAHGVSDKNYRDRMLKTDFNYVIVTGTLWKQKFIEKYKFDESQIFIGGYTKFDDYFNNVNIINNIVKNIVWLPTHNMFPNHSPKVSTYPFFKDYINYIPDKYNFIESLHPANDSKHNSSYDVIINADVVLGGFSGALYEALLLNKPVIFLDWLVEEYILLRFKESFEYDIYKNKIGYHASNINEVVELIEVALQNGVKKETKEFINGILSPELNGKSGITIAEFLKKIDKEYYV
jgi:CDP-glycerol glycerophosphotransferase (TagB/SpsB family)